VAIGAVDVVVLVELELEDDLELEVEVEEDLDVEVEVEVEVDLELEEDEVEDEVEDELRVEEVGRPVWQVLLGVGRTYPEGGSTSARVWRVPLYVEPMVPNLILEKTTWEFGALASTSLGTPEVVAQAPRAIPGWLGSASVGKVESSQSMLTLWSSQMDRTRTWPFASDLPIATSPPLSWNPVRSPKAHF